MPGARFVVGRLPGEGESLRLDGEAAAHARARRLSAGDAVVLVDGSGREASGSIEGVDRAGFVVRVAAVSEAPRDPVPPIHLYVAAVRAERLSWIAEKATELGAATLTLVVSARTQGERAADSLASRLARVVEEAAKQAEHARWPRVEGPVAFAAALGSAAAGHRLLLDSRGEPFPATLSLAPVSLLVGPEGGWTDGEHQEAIAAGWSATSLAAGKLRAETAAVAALTLARTALARGAH